MLAFRLVLVLLWTVLRVSVRRLVGRRRHPDWSWRMEVVAEMARFVAGLTVGVPIRRLRAALPPAPMPRALARQVDLAPRQVGELEAEQLTPAGWTDGDPVLLWLHGGGYAMCSPQTHRDMVARVARATGARGVVIRYRLAPEHPFPAAIDDCVDAYRTLLSEGLDSDQLLLGGDSAGGGLCLATLLRLRDGSEPLPAGAILFSPWVDLEGRGATLETNAAYDYVRGDLLQNFADQYLSGAEASDPLASPLRADLSGLPPLLVQTGGAEALRWENEQLVTLARTAGVDVAHDVRPGFVHVTQGFARFLPEARQAIRDVGDFVRQTVRQAPR